MLNQIKNKTVFKKGGYGTLFMIFALSIILPLLLFACIEIPYYLQMDRKLKQITDNTAASAATFIDNKQLAQGIISIDYNKAKTYILEDLVIWYNLEDMVYDTLLTPTLNVKTMVIEENEDSILLTDPLVIELGPNNEQITDERVLKSTRFEYFIHPSTSKATYTFSTGESITVATPTVGVMVHTRVRGLIYRIPVTYNKIGITEAVFDIEGDRDFGGIRR